jgi:hypothetical protein
MRKVLAEQAQETGLPLTFFSSGPTEFRVDPDGALTMLRTPPKVVSICTVLQ